MARQHNAGTDFAKFADIEPRVKVQAKIKLA
jgi:hypothetical protein